jgi:hypothetical protein
MRELFNSARSLCLCAGLLMVFCSTASALEIAKVKEALRTRICEGRALIDPIDPDAFCKKFECPPNNNSNECYNRWAHCMFTDAPEAIRVVDAYNQMCSGAAKTQPPERSSTPKTGSPGSPKPAETDPGKSQQTLQERLDRVKKTSVRDADADRQARTKMDSVVQSATEHLAREKAAEEGIAQAEKDRLERAERNKKDAAAKAVADQAKVDAARLDKDRNHQEIRKADNWKCFDQTNQCMSSCSREDTTMMPEPCQVVCHRSETAFAGKYCYDVYDVQSSVQPPVRPQSCKAYPYWRRTLTEFGPGAPERAYNCKVLQDGQRQVGMNPPCSCDE